MPSRLEVTRESLIKHMHARTCKRSTRGASQPGEHTPLITHLPCRISSISDLTEHQEKGQFVHDVHTPRHVYKYK